MQAMILVAGSANLDFVVRASHIPQPGETVLGDDLRTYPGGKGANQAVACARAGAADVAMLLALGDDAYAAPLEKSLRDAGVRLHLVRVPAVATGTAFICVSDDAENAITVAPGANAHLLPQHIPDLHGLSHVLLQLEIPLDTVIALAQRARALGVCVVLNAAPARALPAELLALVDILIVNQGELAALVPHGDTIAQRVALLPSDRVVVTLGSQGCCARHGDTWHFQPAFAVSAVDSTGAGDTFCGSLVAALAHGQPLAAALRYASAAGALACTQAGAQAAIPAADALRRWLAQAPAASAQSVAALRLACGA